MPQQDPAYVKGDSPGTPKGHPRESTPLQWDDEEVATEETEEKAVESKTETATEPEVRKAAKPKAKKKKA